MLPGSAICYRDSANCSAPLLAPRLRRFFPSPYPENYLRQTGSGLQIRHPRFESGRGLFFISPAKRCNPDYLGADWRPLVYPVAELGRGESCIIHCLGCNSVQSVAVSVGTERHLFRHLSAPLSAPRHRLFLRCPWPSGQAVLPPERRERTWQTVDRGRDINEAGVRVTVQGERDRRMPGQRLGDLRMHACNGQVADVLVA
jgi:hypothetical protein